MSFYQSKKSETKILIGSQRNRLLILVNENSNICNQDHKKSTKFEKFKSFHVLGIFITVTYNIIIFVVTYYESFDV